MADPYLPENFGTIRILKIHDVVRVIGASRSSVYRWEKSGNFPARRRLSKFRVGWLESEIIEWVTTRPKGI